MNFCGLDVSLRETAVCIVDAEGAILKEMKVASDPEVIAGAITDSGFRCEKVGLESGSTAAWLQAGLVTPSFSTEFEVHPAKDPFSLRVPSTEAIERWIALADQMLSDALQSGAGR